MMLTTIVRINELPWPQAFLSVLTIELIEQFAPALQCLPSSKVRVQHRTCPPAHFRDRSRRIRQAPQSSNQCVGVPRSDDTSAAVLLDQPANFSVLITNDDDGFAGGSDPVEFAWNYQALEFRIERQPMRVSNCQGIWQHFLVLIGNKAE